MATSANEDGRQILSHLNSMLVFDDCESVMNAAGTIGTLVSNWCQLSNNNFLLLSFHFLVLIFSPSFLGTASFCILFNADDS